MIVNDGECKRSRGDSRPRLSSRLNPDRFGRVFAIEDLYVAVDWKAAYNKRMEVSFAPELQAKLNRIASQEGKGPDEVVRELVANYLDHDEWFRREVGKGLASLDQGKTVSHGNVRRQMDRILGS